MNMDAISSVQLVILGIVAVTLMLERIAIISPGSGQPISLFALWGLPIAIIIYRKKDWHKLKRGVRG